jgi:16S rRNA (guanine527-N7)-methyltransferase
VERLVRYAVLVERWSRRHSLICFRDRGELVQRHLAEALAALPSMGEQGVLVDVGSGAGIPGVPLLAVRAEWRGVLLEPRQKRWAFLRTVVRELGLRAVVLATRFEDHRPAVEVDLVTVRGLADVDAVLDWGRSLLSAGGKVLVWGTEEREARLAARAGWRVLSCALAHLERGRLIECRPCFT